MKIAAINFYHPFQKEAIEQLLEEKKVKTFYQFIYPSHTIRDDTIQIETFDLFGLYFPLHFSDYYSQTTISKQSIDVLKKIEQNELENILLKMIDRLVHPYSINFSNTYKNSKFSNKKPFNTKKIFNKYSVNFTLNEKQLMIKMYINFWCSFFNNYKIDYFLFQEAPSMPFDYVGYLTAEYYNVTTIFSEHIPIPGKRVFIRTIKSHAQIIKEEIKKFEKDNITENSFKERLDPFFLKEINRIYFKQEQKKLPQYMANVDFQKKRHNYKFKTLFKNLNFDYFYSRFKQETSPILKDNELRKYYNEISRKPDLSQNYIYVPLHLEPEKTTTPLGEKFGDQLKMLDMLSAYLPTNFKLLVKENPKQASKFRTIEDYIYINKNPKIDLVPIEYDTFELIENSIAVATVTGTAAWEALWRMKPVIVFGGTILQYCKGVHKINKSNDLIYFFENIESIKPQIKDLKTFTLAMQNISFSLPFYNNRNSISGKEWIANHKKGYMSLMNK